jgi:hypothetical protein
MTNRDMTDPRYVKWRRGIFGRDRAICQLCFGVNGKGSQAHHILPWAAYPTMRFEHRNGVCLCYVCHKTVTGNEMSYVELFNQRVAENLKRTPQRARPIGLHNFFKLQRIARGIKDDITEI